MYTIFERQCGVESWAEQGFGIIDVAVWAISNAKNAQSDDVDLRRLCEIIMTFGHSNHNWVAVQLHNNYMAVS